MTDTDLLPCREAFEAWLDSRHISADMGANAWGEPIYRYTHVQAMWEAWEAASTPSSTRANERGDLSDFIKHKQQVIERQMEKHTPQPSPQSDMVAVPREALKDVLCMIANRLNQDVVEEKSSGKLRDAYALLQPYTKGEK